MQEDFVNLVFKNAKAKQIIPVIKDFASKYDGQIIFTLDTHLDNYENTLESKTYPRHCLLGSKGHQIVSELADIKGKKILKPTFGSTELIQFLIQENNKKNIDQLDVVGVCTDICVLTNLCLLRTYFKDKKIVLHENMTAATSEEMQMQAIKIIKNLGIEVL